jgi:hypothetical protein
MLVMPEVPQKSEKLKWQKVKMQVLQLKELEMF